MLTRENKIYAPVPDPNLSPEKVSVRKQKKEERIKNFEEVTSGYSEEEARLEAARCLHCPRPYCVENCPAHVDIPEFIEQIRLGNYNEACEIISRRNKLPALTGRVCAQECQCEAFCTRGIKGEPVAIGRLEAFAADHSERSVRPAEKRPLDGKRVAVIGAGPSGIACAETLAEAGVQVDIFEKRERPGGLVWYGIPPFVLPDEMLTKKVAQLYRLGVQFHLNHQVQKAEDLLDKGYDAVFAGLGAEHPNCLNLPNENADGILPASEYLSAVRSGEMRRTVGHAVVIGGGNTAIDAARCALRGGAAKVTIMYRRDEQNMPARKEEIQNAVEEGVEIMPLTAPVGFATDGVRVTGIAYQKMRLTSPDYPMGRSNVEPVPGSEGQMDADLVVLALGYEVGDSLSIPVDQYGRIIVQEDRVSTLIDGVYSSGDATTGPATVVAAMDGGRSAAEQMIRRFERGS